jgi:lysophospholipase L1-like esterase
VSRHPRLGRDYDATTHAYTRRYLRPRGYRIEVDAFPGKVLLSPAQDQQLPPGGDPKSVQDIWRLDLPPGTTGFEFAVTGQPARTRPIGPRPPTFHASARARLPTLRGIFREHRDDNAWNWRVEVPGPGRYEVTVRVLRPSGPRAPRTATLHLRDLLVVSIGDSAASGQGNPDVPGEAAGFEPELRWWHVLVPALGLFELTRAALDWCHEQLKKDATTLARVGGLTIEMDPEPRWLEPRAYRSLRSAPAHAARLLEDREKGTVVTFLPFGRTGSDIPHGLLGPRTIDGGSIDGWVGDIGQVEEVARTVGRRRIDALLINIGVNDVGVSARLTDLVAGDHPIAGNGDDAANRLEVEAAGLRNLEALPARFEELARALDVLDVRDVYLIEYPTSLFDRADGTVGPGCGIFTSNFDLDLTRKDAQVVRALAERLDAVLRTAAERHGWIYVDGVAEACRGHGYCLREEQRFYVQAEEFHGLQGDTEGTIHPNPAGVSEIARRILAAVRPRVAASPGSGPVAGGPQAPVVVKA